MHCRRKKYCNWLSDALNFLSMIYRTSLDNSAKIITTGITVLFAVIIFARLSAITDEGIRNAFFLPVFLGAIYFIAYAFRPVKYELTDQELIVHRLLGDVKFPRSEIITGERIERGKTSWALRIFGVGGLFGYYGKFTNTQLGVMTWYATRRNKIVLIKTAAGKKIILTPDDPAEFTADLNKP